MLYTDSFIIGRLKKISTKTKTNGTALAVPNLHFDKQVIINV